MAWPVVAAIAGGSILNNIIGHNQTIDQNNKSAAQSREQMDFQERMSNTAHQREVADLKAAGLNPTLSAGGSGASSPAGSSAPIARPEIEMPDIFGAIMGMTQLDQAQQRLDIDKGLAASTMAKNLTDSELTKAETILRKKGMIRAELEEGVSKKIKQGIDWMSKAKRKVPRLDQLDMDQQMEDGFRRRMP